MLTPIFTLPEAIKILQDALNEDKSEGNSLYYTWQSNIAMAFYDAVIKQCNGKNLYDDSFGDESLHEVSNNAAKNFLNQLISK